TQVWVWWLQLQTTALSPASQPWTRSGVAQNNTCESTECAPLLLRLGKGEGWCGLVRVVLERAGVGQKARFTAADPARRVHPVVE
ncbi:hypothetical protein V8C86DRAFT_2553448, partial [Haematococcus lacustris]